MLYGDLPGPSNPEGHTTPVQVLVDAAFWDHSHTDEGRAMLQVVHDAAPGAALAFGCGQGGEAFLATRIRDLQAAGCDVIVDDLLYPTEPMFQDVVVA